MRRAYFYLYRRVEFINFVAIYVLFSPEDILGYNLNVKELSMARARLTNLLSMNKIRLSVAAVIGVLCLSACNDENPWVGQGEGRISPRVAADPAVKDVAPTLRAGEDGFPVPTVSDLKLSLTKADGTMSQTWESADLFPTDKLFKIGAYTLEASYGESDAEGFEKPYFYGKADFTVMEDEVAEPTLTAKLANTMVSVDYTQDFLNYFKGYATQLHSAGGDFITIEHGETRPVFLRPGEVTITMSITKQNGVSATIEAAKFSADPQHHYHLTFDVNGGETGDAQLQVIFDSSIVTDDVVIDLSDELMLSPEPKVVPTGFTHDTPIDLVEGSVPDSPAYFTITALGGMSAVTLTIDSKSLQELGIPSEIDLLSASESQKALLTQYGLEVKGLWRNPDKMASVDITGLLSYLKGNDTHKFTLVVKDKLSKVNLPVTAVFSTEPVVLKITSTPSVGLEDTEATITVDYNGSAPTKNITVEALNTFGVWKPCNIISASKSNTRAAESYNIRFELPESDDDVKIRVKYKDSVKDEGVIVRSGAVLKVKSTGDIWATKASLQLRKKSSTPYSSMKYYISTGGGSYVAANPTVNESTGMVTFTGLTAGTSYSVKASDTNQYEESYAASTFTTETAQQPQNAGMDTWSQSAGWHRTSVGIGKETIYEYYPGSSNNDYWATRNAMTAGDWGYASCFYNAYSGTYSAAGANGQAAEICSIGWSNTAQNTYTLLGGNCNQVSAGYLFMGTYSYNHDTNTETVNLGRPFTSRPSSVQFDYKYAPVSGESWDVVVVVENREGGKTTELGRGTVVSAETVSNFTSINVPVTYSNTSLKATHAYVFFRSSTASSPAKSNVRGSASALQGYSDSMYKGSTLTVDNIVFKY